MLLIIIVLILLIYTNFKLKDIGHPFFIYLLYHFLFLFVGFFFKSYIDTYVDFDDNILYLLSWGMIGSIIGFWVIPIKLHSNNNNISLAKSDYYIALLFVFLGSLLALSFFQKVGGVPILADNSEVFRIDARKGNGLQTLASISFFSIGGTLLGQYLLVRKKILKALMGYAIVSFFLISFGNRAPLFYFIVFNVFVFLKIYRKNLSLVYVAVGGVVGLLFLGITAIYRGNLTLKIDAEYSEILFSQILWRPAVNIQNFAAIIEHFKQPIYGYGYYLDFITILPGTSINFGTWVKNQLGWVFDGGSVTITYLGDLYINFGFIVMLIGPLVNGVLINLLSQ